MTRTALLTPMRLLTGIAALTILCMLAVAAITEHLAAVSFSSSSSGPSSRVHLISRVTEALKHAQDCRKAYLTTGNTEYLSQYRNACADVDGSMDRLVAQDAEVTNNLAHAQGIRSYLHQKLVEIGQVLTFHHAAAATAAVPAIQAPAAQAAAPLSAVDSDLARIQKLLDALGQEESRDMASQLEQAQARTVFHRNVVIAVAGVNLLFLIGVAFCAMQIRKLYSLVTMCAWSKRVHYEDQWIPLEDYVQKRFGVRISHGISQEEYAKWGDNSGAESAPPAPVNAASSPNAAPARKAAA